MFPSTLQTKELDTQHPDFVERLGCWNDIDALCQSGFRMKKQAEHFLAKRQKELAEVFAARVQNFTYQDILGTSLGWYVSAMFKDAPDIHIRQGEADLETPDPFYPAFLADCDRAGTNFVDLAKRVFMSLLQFQASYILTDLPSTGIETPMASLADQKATGALNPYLVVYDPRQVINWECDAYGNLLWVVIATTAEQQRFSKPSTITDRWYYFDRTRYAVYEAARKDRSRKEEIAVLADSGPHALADKDRVPIRRLAVPDTLWLANRVYLHALAHLNTENALDWGIKQGCLPVLYIKGEYKEPPVRSEVGFIQLEENSDIGYVQPDASTFTIAEKRLGSIREEMYRQLYLQAQGRSSSATPAAQSGYSKEIDMAPSSDVLNGLGDILRAGMCGIFRDVADAHNDPDIDADIRGFSFDETDEAGELAKFDMFMDSDLAVASPTLDREMKKKQARVMLPDARPELQTTIDAEIDAAPTKKDIQEQQAQQQQDQMAKALTSATTRWSGKQAIAEL